MSDTIASTETPEQQETNPTKPRTAKLQFKIDTMVVLERMREFVGLKNLAELAEYLELSSQAIGNARTRSSISLSLIMTYIKKSGASIEWILYGKKTDYLTPKKICEDSIAESQLSISQEWIKNGLGASPSSVCYYAEKNNRYFLVDTSASNKKLSEGTFLIKAGNAMFVRQCSAKLDGSISIDGEKASLTVAEASKIEVVGRVIYRCEQV